MKTLETNIPGGIGDLIYLKGQFDSVKNKYSSIKLSIDNWVLKEYRNDINYNNFINNFGLLLFNEPPYVFNNGQYKFRTHMQIYEEFGIEPVIPRLNKILCKGASLNLSKKYIVINTKVRYFPISHFNEISYKFSEILKNLSKKYKIVILGEKLVEENKEYKIHGIENIYSIYNFLINNLNNDDIVDLTVPSLGITVPNINKILQDCLIMNEAEFVINLGVGGSFCMATATATAFCYRIDGDVTADFIFSNSKKYQYGLVTKNWNEFISNLMGYV